MRFYLPSIKQSLTIIITVLLCIGTGLILLVAVHALIPNDAINENAKESARVFAMEGTYPEIDPNSTSILDNYTDALMLKNAAYDGEESAFRKTLISPRWILIDKNYDWPDQEYVEYYSRSTPEPRTIASYARYWHGYLVSLRPVLALNNYGQIRALNIYLQVLLTLVIVLLMIVKGCWQIIPAYIISILHIGIRAVAYSLQHSTVQYVFSIACIVMLLINDKLKANDTLIFFTIIGAATSYMDFLTYPLATFGMTAVLYLCLNRNDSNKMDFRNITNLLICWAVGYAGMWAGKWILTTLFTEQNIINDAINAIKFRSSSDVYGQAFTYGDVVSRNIGAYTFTNIAVFVPIAFAIEVLCLILFKSKLNKTMMISCLFIALLPFAWMIMAGNHCFIHARFTNKMFIGSTFAILVAFACWNPQKSIKKSKRRIL